MRYGISVRQPKMKLKNASPPLMNSTAQTPLKRVSRCPRDQGGASSSGKCRAKARNPVSASACTTACSASNITRPAVERFAYQTKYCPELNHMPYRKNPHVDHVALCHAR